MNVKRIILFITISLLATNAGFAQQGYIQQGEFGFSAGIGHYFGDLNTRSALNRPKPSLGVFFRKQFGEYVSMRVAGRFAQLGYSDIYSKNEYQKLRNLSFNSNIFEFAVQGDFNFYRYVPTDVNYNFTPYVTLGLGVFSYDPYAYDDDGVKQYLRPLHTEGQTMNIPGYEDRDKEYSTMAICIPFGVGIKYSINPKVNLSFEVTHRFTTTDYLDDVSKTYVGVSNFGVDANGLPTTAALLQDRSEGQSLGVAGRQRGWSKQKDQYVIAEVGLSFNLGSYRCPTAF